MQKKNLIKRLLQINEKCETDILSYHHERRQVKWLLGKFLETVKINRKAKWSLMIILRMKFMQ